MCYVRYYIIKGLCSVLSFITYVAHDPVSKKCYIHTYVPLPSDGWVGLAEHRPMWSSLCHLEHAVKWCIPP